MTLIQTPKHKTPSDNTQSQKHIPSNKIKQEHNYQNISTDVEGYRSTFNNYAKLLSNNQKERDLL